MQKRKRRKSDRAGRPALHSPRRPSVARREERQEFWKAIALGLSSEDAAVSCGVSPPVGGRWFRQGGGMAPVGLAPRSDRYLSFAEREEIAILKARGAGVRDIARRLGRAPSTVSRELRRNAATRGGGFEYRASTAQWHSDRRAKRPKKAKLAVNDRLRSYVQQRLAGAVMTEDRSAVPGPKAGPWTGGRHEVRGSGAPTRTPMVCFASTFRRAPICAGTARAILLRWQPHSMADLERPSTGKSS